MEIEDEGGFNLADVERAQDEVDVCIVGGGPAGLSAAIRLKQLEAEKGREIRVVVLEKGAEVGELFKCFVTLMPSTDLFRSQDHIFSLAPSSKHELSTNLSPTGAPSARRSTNQPSQIPCVSSLKTTRSRCLTRLK